MNSNELLAVSQGLADCITSLTAAVNEKDERYKEMEILQAKYHLVIIQKEILKHATETMLKEKDA